MVQNAVVRNVKVPVIFTFFLVDLVCNAVVNTIAVPEVCKTSCEWIWYVMQKDGQ